jgi:NADPH:quinone reductase-like Zn-dependent oxidoreductase
MVYRRYGGPDVLELADVPDPTPRDSELLVRVRATSVTAADWRARSLKVPQGFELFARPAFGMLGPRRKVLGAELSGDVVAVGSKVTKFEVGDAIFALTGMRYGGYAELAVVPEHIAVARKPANISYEEAAGLSFGGMTALDFLRRGAVKAGETMLINGASGGVGIATVQLAHHMGLTVTSVTSGPNAALLASHGAHRVIDYTRENFLTLGERWDHIMDCVGNVTLDEVWPVVTKGGTFMAVVGPLGTLFTGGKAKKLGIRLVAGSAAELPADVRRLAELAATGACRTVIDRVYPLEQAAEAHAYVETGRKRGSVILTVGARPAALGAAA